MIGDRQKTAELILEKSLPKDGKDSAASRMFPGDGDQGLEVAAEDIITAVHARDAGALALALKSAFEMLDGSNSEAGPEETE